jgi:hypothetical protein
VLGQQTAAAVGRVQREEVGGARRVGAAVAHGVRLG